MLGDKKMQHAWMKYADSNDIPHDHEDEEPFKQGFAMAQNHSDKSAELAQLREKLAAVRTVVEMFGEWDMLDATSDGPYFKALCADTLAIIDGKDVLKEGM